MKLTDTARNILEKAKKRYETDFISFYQSLAGHFIGDKTIVRDLTASRRQVENTIDAIDTLLNPALEVTKERVDLLVREFSLIDENFKTWLERSKGDIELEDKLSAIAEKRHVSLEQLSSAQKVIEGRFEKSIQVPAVPPEISAKIKSVLSGVGTVATKLLPFGKPLRGGVGKAQGYFDRRAIKIEEQEQETLEEALTPTSVNPVGKTPVNRERESNSKLTEKISLSEGASLFSFFNVGAYKARWTKELLEAVQVKSETKQQQKSYGFPSLMKDAVSNLLLKPLSLVLTNPYITIGLATLAIAGWTYHTEAEKTKKDLVSEDFVLDPHKGLKVNQDPRHKISDPAVLNLMKTGVPRDRALAAAASERQSRMAMNITSMVPGVPGGAGQEYYGAGSVVETMSTAVSSLKSKIPDIPTVINSMSGGIWKPLVDSLEKLIEELNNKKTVHITPSSGNYQAYDIRDSLISGVSGGQIDV